MHSAHLSDQEVKNAFLRIRRAQRAGVYAPHKPLLILLALGRIQQAKPRLASFEQIDAPLKSLLTEFGPSSAPSSRHYPFWHLATDGDSALWQLRGPKEVLGRPPAATPNLGELRKYQIEGGFSPAIDMALRARPALLAAVAEQVLNNYFPSTLHADILQATGLDLESAGHQAAEGDGPEYPPALRKRRDPGFREKVLRAYEFKCCVCGFYLRVGHMPAGLEAAHIQWHTAGGPDIEANGLSLCALHHKLFDLGAFTIEPEQYRIAFSQHATGADSTAGGALAPHGEQLKMPQQTEFMPAKPFLEWHAHNVFKKPWRT